MSQELATRDSKKLSSCEAVSETCAQFVLFSRSLKDLDNWANDMLSVAKSLDRSDLPPHVYQEAMERFEALSASALEHEANARTLPGVLEELLAGAPPEERKKFQQKLEGALKAVKEATAASQKAEDKGECVIQELRHWVEFHVDLNLNFEYDFD